jgi:hypothetical protein
VGHIDMCSKAFRCEDVLGEELNGSGMQRLGWRIKIWLFRRLVGNCVGFGRFDGMELSMSYERCWL